MADEPTKYVNKIYQQNETTKRAQKNEPNKTSLTKAERTMAERKGIQQRYDVLIVGTGVAGLNAALHLPEDKKILLISKE